MARDLKKEKLVLWFSEIDKDNIDLAGGKGANLGELVKAGLPVPNGFCVTAKAYYHFLDKTKLRSKFLSLLAGINPEDSKKLNKISKEIKKLIIAAKMPEDLEKAIRGAYQKLGGFPVAVRSSATAEDLPSASFAGQQMTYLNMKTPDEVVLAVQKCYASLYEGRAIYYRIVNHFDHMKIGIAVPIQNMVQSEKSGIMFTVDPVSQDPNSLVIEAGYGLGEAIVSGSITPDRYLFDKTTKQISNKEINQQAWQIVGEFKGGDKHVSIAKAKQKAQKISDDQIIKLAELGLSIEKHYGKPQDTEWAIEGEKIYFVQSRPITTLGNSESALRLRSGQASQQVSPTSPRLRGAGESAGQQVSETVDGKLNNIDQVTSPPADKLEAEVILKGAAASMGSAFGPVKIIYKPTEIDKVEKGDVLVTEMTTPDFVPAMRRAAAIVTDTGGRTCHAAIVSRELGIPCIVGTGTATHVLKNGQVVTVDGKSGSVYRGNILISKPKEEAVSGSSVSGSALVEEVPITGTKVYVNLGEPHLAAEVAKLPVDGVGLLRAEFIIAEMGEHPRAMVEAGRGKDYVNRLAEGIRTIAAAFAPRPVVYRATDFKTNEYRNLKGGDKYEPAENNPMIGYRGASRYVREPDLFALELEAIKVVRETHDLKNLWLMIPFVRTLEEMRQVKKLVEASGLRQSPDFKLWMMCEIPSNVILLDKFLDLGIDGISIGSNDLTQLTLGADRDNEGLAKIFDERDEAVVLSIEYIIKTCRKHNVTCSICGQAPSVYPEITEMMVKAGTTSVSVSADVVVQTRKLIASVEKRLILANIIDR